MKLSSIIEALIAAGATPEMILAAVRAAEAEMEAAQTEIDARREKDRERQRRHRMSRDVTLCHVSHSDKRDTPPLSGANGFPDLSLTPNSPPKENPLKGSKEKSPEFAEWYSLYPHKIGRAAAEKAFAVAERKATHAELLEGLRRYIRTKPPDREYCNPATWLNQERWKDDPAPNEGISHAKPSTYHSKHEPSRSKTTESLAALHAAGSRILQRQQVEPGTGAEKASGGLPGIESRT